MSFMEHKKSNTGVLTSVEIRINSVVMPFIVFLSSPIIGVGYQNLRELTLATTFGDITCTFVNWFAIYGILFGIIMLVGYLKLLINIRSTERKRIDTMLGLLILITSIISEDYSQNAIFLGLGFFGYLQSAGYNWLDREVYGIEKYD